MSVRVVVSVNIEAGKEAGFEAAFAEVSRRMKGTPGRIRDELLRDPRTRGAYLLVGVWDTAAAFHAWHDCPEHSKTTAPMRRFWLGRTERRIYDVAVDIRPYEPACAHSSPAFAGAE